MTTLALPLVLLPGQCGSSRSVAPVARSVRSVACWVEALACALLVLVNCRWASHQLLRSSASSCAVVAGGVRQAVLAAGTASTRSSCFRALVISGGSALLGKVFRMSARVALLLC